MEKMPPRTVRNFHVRCLMQYKVQFAFSVLKRSEHLIHFSVFSTLLHQNKLQVQFFCQPVQNYHMAQILCIVYSGSPCKSLTIALDYLCFHQIRKYSNPKKRFVYFWALLIMLDEKSTVALKLLPTLKRKFLHI